MLLPNACMLTFWDSFCFVAECLYSYKQSSIHTNTAHVICVNQYSTICPGHYYNRIHVTSVGCLMWGICTAGFSMCRSLQEGYFFWAINGIGLSLVIPTGQSLIADYYQASDPALLCMPIQSPLDTRTFFMRTTSMYGQRNWESTTAL